MPIKSNARRSVAHIRQAEPADAAALSPLLSQLGYPAQPASIPARLAALNASQAAIALVAEDAGGKIVGLITAHIFSSIHDDAPVAWITTLVVLDSARGMGIGSLLVASAESWATKRGAKKISVTSGNQRADAHRFYQDREYGRSGLRFTKKLGGN